MTTAGGPAGEHLRGRPTSARAPSLPATGVLRRGRRFRHLLSFVLVNVLLVVVWLIAGITSDSWFFWPLFLLVGWGVLLDVHAWWAYGRPTRAGSDRSAAP